MTEEPSRSSKPSRTTRRERFQLRMGLVAGAVAGLILVFASVLVISQKFRADHSAVVDEDVLKSRFQPTLDVTHGLSLPVKDAAKPIIGASPSPRTSAVRQGIQEWDGKRKGIMDAVKACLAADNMEARLNHVRDPRRVRPLMEAHEKRVPWISRRMRDIGWVVPVDEPVCRLVLVEALFEDSEPAQVIVEETPDGDFKIDWESLVCYGDMAWDEFQRTKPSKPCLLRVTASKVSPAAGFNGEGSWIELRHPSLPGTVLGFFNERDPTFGQLVIQLEAGNWRDVPVALRLNFPSEGALRMSNRVEIAGVEGRGWLILPEKPHG